MSHSLVFVRRALALSALSLFASQATAEVIVVDAAGGGDFTAIQPAVDAALAGDTILVKSGSYASFLVNAKALAVVGDAGANVEVLGAVRVRSLPVGGTVVLSNLTATGLPGTPATRYGLYLSDNQGAVRASASFFSGASAASPTQRDGADGLYCELSPDVVVTRSGLFGGQGWPGFDAPDLPGVSGAGARLIGSRVAFYDCALEGGHGQTGNNSLTDGAEGGAGCRAQQSTFFASNTTCLGGNGGNGVNPAFPFSFGGDGGHGIALESGALARLLDVVAAGGSGGIGWLGTQQSQAASGSAGQARLGAPAQFIDIAGTGRELVSETVVRVGSALAMTLSGEPGDQVGLLLGPTTNHVFLPNLRGVLTVGVTHPARVLQLGTVPASGTFSFNLAIPALPLGVEEDRLCIQPLFYDLQQRQRLGSALSLVVLDATF